MATRQESVLSALTLSHVAPGGAERLAPDGASDRTGPDRTACSQTDRVTSQSPPQNTRFRVHNQPLPFALYIPLRSVCRLLNDSVSAVEFTSNDTGGKDSEGGDHGLSPDRFFHSSTLTERPKTNSKKLSEERR